MEEVERRLGYSAIRRIRDKQQGSLNNETGSEFEIQIVVKCVLALAKETLRDDSFIKSRITQNGACLVDDIVIETPTAVIMAQVKHVAGLAWTSPGLVRDFQRQLRIRDMVDRPLHLHLYVHDADVAQSLKDTAKDYGLGDVQIIAIPKNRYASSNSARELCFGFRDERDTKNVIRHIESAWNDCGRSARLSDVLEQASFASYGMVKSLVPANPFAKHAIDFIPDMPGLLVQADGNNMLVEIETEGGTFRSVEADVDWEDLSWRLESAAAEGRLESIHMVWDVIKGARRCF